MSHVPDTLDPSLALPVKISLRISLLVLALSVIGATWHHYLGADATAAFCREADWLHPPAMRDGLGPSERARHCETAVARSVVFLASVAAFGAVAMLVLTVTGAGGASGGARGMARSTRGRGDPLGSAPAAIDWALVLGLTGLGLLLRLPVLNIGMWRDEASTYFNSTLPGWEGFVERLVYSELNPPVYYVIMRQWIEWFGGDEIALKTPSLIFGLLMIPAGYALGRVVGSRSAGLVSAGLVAISPKAIYYSQEARPYTIAALLAAVAVAFFIRGLRQPRPGWSLVGFVLAATTLIYAHYTGLMLLGALAVIAAVLVWWQGDTGRLARFAAAFSAIFLLYLPWLGTFLEHLGTGTPWTLKEPWPDRPLLLLKNIAYPVPLEAHKYVDGLLALVILAAMAASLRRYLRTGRAPAVRGGSPELGAVVTGAAYLGTAIMLTVLSYSGRYMFAFLPIACAFHAIWLCRAGRYLAERRWVHPAPVLLLILYGWGAVSIWPEATADAVPKSGVRTLAAEIGTSLDEDALFLVSPDYLGPTFGYYTRGRSLNFFGFARQDDPHIFSPLGYAEIWNRPGAMTEAEGLVRQRADEGMRRLIVIRQGCGEQAEDRGVMPYSKSDELFARLLAAYPLLEERAYPGLRECVSLHVFDISPSG